jgi:hypothetical protein
VLLPAARRIHVSNSWSEFQEIAILPGLGAILAFLIALVLVVVVVLPAVWSRDARRRAAALTVLRLLLHHWSQRKTSKSVRRLRSARESEQAAQADRDV